MRKNETAEIILDAPNPPGGVDVVFDVQVEYADSDDKDDLKVL